MIYFGFTDLAASNPRRVVAVPTGQPDLDLGAWARAEAKRTCARGTPEAGLELRAFLLRIQAEAARQTGSAVTLLAFPSREIPDVHYVLRIDVDEYEDEPRPALDRLAEEWIEQELEQLRPLVLSAVELADVEIPAGPARSVHVVIADDERFTSEQLCIVTLPTSYDTVAVTFSAGTSDPNLGGSMCEVLTLLAESFEVIGVEPAGPSR
ncbi:MAG: hypothetical protein HOV87_36065 [Catenulispora sp.]|nr:hypothetical protein [Catenulispora sp.]